MEVKVRRGEERRGEERRGAEPFGGPGTSEMRDAATRLGPRWMMKGREGGKGLAGKEETNCTAAS